MPRLQLFTCRLEGKVLDDTIEAARLINMLDLKGCPDSEENDILRTGIKQLDNHIISTRFSLSRAKPAPPRPLG